MDWLAPVAALVGVVIGGLLNAALTDASERRRDRAAAAVAARLVTDELRLIRDTIASALEDGRWGAILDPGLPYSRGLWAVEHREGKRPDAAWPESASALARALTAAEWEPVSTAYALVDRLGLRFWTDEPDRELTDDVRAAFADVIEAVPSALDALEHIASGKARGRPR
jgi:hypothetical protein